jgi:serine/threonine protein kinase
MPDSAQSSHPGPAQLAAFAQDKLATSERAALQAHLKACPACRQALAALPADGASASGQETLATMGALPARATAPRRSGNDVPDTLATMGAPLSGATSSHHPGSAVPADLANHPRYEVLQLLGQGGMGAVYKARHKKMDRFVALKVINAKLLDNPKALERFQREVKAAAKLEHPNIVRAYDADEAGGTHFLVMEFVEGTDLAKYVEKKGPLPVDHACHFIRQAALGLEHAHQQGMVHRDIKPHNLMLAAPVASAAAAPVVKVMDFGLARLARERASEAALTGENALMGTADYIAPEQAQDAHHADIRADIYSLGCSLCHLLAGRPLLAGAPVTQKLAAHLTGKLPLGELPASVPPELRTVLAKMVAKEPVQRYQTPGEVAAALVPFLKKAAGVKLPRVPISVAPLGESDDATIASEGTKSPASGRGYAIAVTPLIAAGYIAAIIVMILAGQPARSAAEYENLMQLGLLLALLFWLSAFITSLFGLYRMWSVVARSPDDPTPGEAVGLLCVPFYNLYWMFRAIPGLSAALKRELHERDPSGHHGAGWKIGLAACVLFCIPYLNLVVPIVFAVWINIANSATNRLIRLREGKSVMA